MSSISTICICGAGTMGTGIAQVAASTGFHVTVYDLNEQMLQRSSGKLQSDLERLVGKKKITGEEKKNILDNIKFSNNINDCLADVIIEAIIEDYEPKIALFNQLAELNHSETILASNTSSLSLNKLASGIKNPERVIGMHFFNPAPVMPLVEIINTDRTNSYTSGMIRELAISMKKTPVMVRDSPGFIVNRVARPFYIESLRLVEDGFANFNKLDNLLEAAGFKLGPFRLMDLIGNDINYAVSCSLFEQLERPERLKPSKIQEKLVSEKKLGKKSGEGYYKYDKQ